MVYDKDGMDNITADINGDGVDDAVTDVPTRVAAVTYLGMRKASSPDQPIHEQTYWSENLNSIYDLTKDNYDKYTKSLAMITTSEDTLDEMKKWIQWNAFNWKNGWFSLRCYSSSISS